MHCLPIAPPPLSRMTAATTPHSRDVMFPRQPTHRPPAGCCWPTCTPPWGAAPWAYGAAAPWWRRASCHTTRSGPPARWVCGRRGRGGGSGLHSLHLLASVCARCLAPPPLVPPWMFCPSCNTLPLRFTGTPPWPLLLIPGTAFLVRALPGTAFLVLPPAGHNPHRAAVG